MIGTTQFLLEAPVMESKGVDVQSKSCDLKYVARVMTK